MWFLDAIRQLRNAYTHDISMCDETILAMALREKNAPHLLMAISAVEKDGYDYSSHVVLLMENPAILRFGIMHEALQYLGMSYRQWAPGETPANQ
jgi:hypothetical protein